MSEFFSSRNVWHYTARAWIDSLNIAAGRDYVNNNEIDKIMQVNMVVILGKFHLLNYKGD
jgi:hypothetical protein